MEKFMKKHRTQGQPAHPHSSHWEWWGHLRVYGSAGRLQWFKWQFLLCRLLRLLVEQLGVQCWPRLSPDHELPQRKRLLPQLR